MTRQTRPALFTLPLLLCALVLTACSGTNQRAVHRIETSGDRAVRNGDFAFAAEEYTQVVRRRPGRWETRVKLADALIEDGQPALAREQLEVAYTLRPTNARVLDLLATAMLASGDTAAMTRELRFAAEESGKAADWFRLGVFLSRAGDDDAAEIALLTAARLDGGENIAFQKGLANFYASVGDDDRALNRFRMAYFLDPEDEEVLSALRSMGHAPGPTFALIPSEQDAGIPN